MAAGDVVYERVIGIYRMVIVETEEEGELGVMALPVEGYSLEQAEEAFRRDVDALTAYGLVQMSGVEGGVEEGVAEG